MKKMKITAIQTKSPIIRNVSLNNKNMEQVKRFNYQCCDVSFIKDGIIGKKS